MNIAIICPEIDCAGTGWNLRCAINKYTEHKAKHIVGMTSFWSPETDCLMHEEDKVRQIIQESDILHFMHKPWENKAMLQGKKTLYHLHGGLVDCFPEKVYELCADAGAKLITCSPSEHRLFWKQSMYLPPVIDWTDWVLPERDVQDKILISMAHDLKSYHRSEQHYIDYLDPMKHIGFPIEFNCVWDTQKADAIKQRLGSHLFIENMLKQCLGMGSLEALCMGQIVMARVSPYIQDIYRSILGSPVPVTEVNDIREIINCLHKIKDNRNYLLDGFKANLAWREKHYHPKTLVELYIREYEK